MSGRREGEGEPAVESDELRDDEPADVEIFTGVRARSLRFEVVPEVKVGFDGHPAQRSSSRTERENLPEQLEAGKTYRNAGARWRARARIVHPADAAEEEGDGKPRE